MQDGNRTHSGTLSPCKQAITRFPLQRGQTLLLYPQLKYMSRVVGQNSLTPRGKQNLLTL